MFVCFVVCLFTYFCFLLIFIFPCLPESTWICANQWKFAWIYIISYESVRVRANLLESVQSIQICTSLWKSMQICANFCKFTWIYSSLHKSVQVCMNLCEFVGIYTNLSEFVQIFMNLCTFTQICVNLHKFAWICVSLCESTQICANLYESMRICTNLHELVPICVHFWYTPFNVSYWISIAWSFRHLPGFSAGMWVSQSVTTLGIKLL